MAVKSTEFGKRFKQKVEELYPSFAKFASKLGIKPQSLQNFFRGRVPDPVKLELFAEALNVTPHWLLTGHDFEVEIPEKEKSYEIVPQVDGFISGGHGALPSSEIKDWLWIPKKYLPGKGEGLRYAAIEVKGDSMEPLLNEGEVVVIDCTDRDINNLREVSLYAVWKEAENMTFVKQVVYNKGENMLTLISFNQDARPRVEHIKLKKGMGSPIMGKVVFSFRRWR